MQLSSLHSPHDSVAVTSRNMQEPTGEDVSRKTKLLDKIQRS